MLLYVSPVIPLCFAPGLANILRMIFPFCLCEMAGKELSMFAKHLSFISVRTVLFAVEGWLCWAIRGLLRFVSGDLGTCFLQRESMSILNLLWARSEKVRVIRMLYDICCIWAFLFTYGQHFFPSTKLTWRHFRKMKEVCDGFIRNWSNHDVMSVWWLETSENFK
jgi:hypothetical protein